jgi:hypothetical protein
MKLKSLFLAIFAVFLLSAISIANNLTEDAISADKNISENAIKELRLQGQKGLDSLFQTYSAEIKKFMETGENTENWQKISYAIDGVAKQKDAYASQLFWFTDLDEAKKQAKAQNKPILTLRLLGNLDEEYSCANSRFFRSILYPNAEISKFLRENYILHWKSIRPAPRITIDFGDGRKIERTVTGNSIHYVINQDGTVIDAIAGLNSPSKFLSFLQNSKILSSSVNDNKNLGDNKLSLFAPDYLIRSRTNKYTFLNDQINRISNQVGLNFDTGKIASRDYEEMPPAIISASLAISKMAVEIKPLKNFTADVTRYGDEQINLEQWKKIASLSKNETKLDANSLAFIKRQTKLDGKDFAKLIENLETYISVDTARNDFLMHPTILVWLNKGEDKDVEKLNEKIYAKLFLTPNNDKWLGLYSPEFYTGLADNGVIK